MKRCIFLVLLTGCGQDELKRVPKNSVEVIYSDDDPCKKHTEVPNPLDPRSPEEFQEEDTADPVGPSFPSKDYATEGE